MNPLDELYQAVILDHSRNPRNAGPQDVPPAVHAAGVNPSCGDELEVWVTFGPDGRLERVTSSGQGCAISQAAASVMTVLTTGRTVDEARRMLSDFHGVVGGQREVSFDEHGELAAFAGVRRFPQRVKCAMLGWRALEQILNSRPDATVSTEEGRD